MSVNFHSRFQRFLMAFGKRSWVSASARYAIFPAHLCQTWHASGITAVHQSRIIDLRLVCELGNRQTQAQTKETPDDTGILLALLLFDFETAREL
jgi:hypothetical protein